MPGEKGAVSKGPCGLQRSLSSLFHIRAGNPPQGGNYSGPGPVPRITTRRRLVSGGSVPPEPSPPLHVDPGSDH